MSDCPLADDCPSFSERIAGMGCQYYGDRGGAEWCDHYERPISELKQQPVKPGEEVIVTVEDIHESGAGVGRTEDGFIVFVDGLLPDARAIVRIDRVKGSHARAKKIVERLPLDPEAEGNEAGETSGTGESTGADAKSKGSGRDGPKRPEALGSRDNFWGE
ncbi:MULTISPECIES: TRAM domain-containing protein [unclassified Haloferax]|uniref:TRAM domain-containing protein n=1 Tax=Haloferax TaxID=2251 RepID=UPI0002AF9053|nr:MULTISPECIES: TRAM domain-containing protein [unclassified Haloferax]ELZ62616.1 tram domain-containing protein [Haloferax sp. ATCC BAA-645]